MPEPTQKIYIAGVISHEYNDETYEFNDGIEQIIGAHYTKEAANRAVEEANAQWFTSHSFWLYVGYDGWTDFTSLEEFEFVQKLLKLLIDAGLPESDAKAQIPWDFDTPSNNTPGEEWDRWQEWKLPENLDLETKLKILDMTNIGLHTVMEAELKP